jgi:hypothetical protein
VTAVIIPITRMVATTKGCLHSFVLGSASEHKRDFHRLIATVWNRLAMHWKGFGDFGHISWKELLREDGGIGTVFSGKGSCALGID